MRNEPRDAFKVVLVDVALKQTLLDPVLEALVSKVDAELVEGVGSTGHVLWAGEVEKADEGSEVVLSQTLINVLVQPRKEERVESFGKIVSVIRCTIWIEEHRTKLLLDKLGLVRQRGLQSSRLDAQKVGHNLKNVRIPYNSRIFIAMTINGEFEVAKVEDSSNELARLRNMSFGKPNCFQGYFELIEALRIFVMPRSRNPCPTLAKVPVGGFVGEVKVLPFFW